MRFTDGVAPRNVAVPPLSVQDRVLRGSDGRVLPRPVSALDDLLAPDRLVELTQPLGEATALWPGSTPFAARHVLDYDADGAYARELAVPEHAGTHLDAPAHFARGGRRVHELPLGELVRPLVKLDVRGWVDDDASATIGRDVIEELEQRDGLIPAGLPC